MTQTERTKAVIAAAYAGETAGHIIGAIEKHARELAEMIDRMGGACSASLHIPDESPTSTGTSGHQPNKPL